MKKSIVIYFSASGITAEVAKRLANTIQADIFEIKPEIPYTPNDLNWTDKNSRSSVEMRDRACRPVIAGSIPNFKKYEVVFLGFPIWWYREPSIIDTFMETTSLEGKTIIPFATSGGSGLGETAHNLQALAPQTHVKEGARFEENASESELKTWATKYIL